MDGLYLQSPLRTISVLVFHLLLTHFCRGESQLIGPPQPIVARVGDDIILPCHLEPAMDVVAKTLEWTRSDLDVDVHVRRLELEKRSFIELVVASGAVSSPVISIAGVDGDRGGVVLQCESKGWYPQPEVFWLDGEGNLLSAGPTETVKGPDDLYNVSSRVTVEKRHNNNFTCRVQQNNINQTKETHIIVNPDGFFKVLLSSFTVTTGLAVSLALCIVLIVAAAVFFFGWKWRPDQTKRSHWDEIEGGGCNATEMQHLNEEGTDRDTAQLERDEAAATQSFISLSPLERDEAAPVWSSISVSEKKQDELLKEKKKLEIEVTDLNSRLSMKETEVNLIIIHFLN
ncbi:butyrophilin subfamily 3 member A2-like [Thunnus albacares]|uniref:butyrophilin subfamily 3 member A2-like n=1 Tax=Thunnus albacares TaxID=8236 RepID=UPI001CF6AE8C|nr:butyrophilin subfamily 3 member A2-like [Thunnus albacares]